MGLTRRSVARVKAAHKSIVKETRDAIEAASNEAARAALRMVNERPRFNPQTGALQKATKAKVVRLKSGAKLRLTNNKPYAPSIDGGARPHIIRAKGGGVLRFKGRDGNWVSTKQVRHPGNVPYRFLYGATQVAGRVLQRSLRERLARIARRY